MAIVRRLTGSVVILVGRPQPTGRTALDKTRAPGNSRPAEIVAALHPDNNRLAAIARELPTDNNPAAPIVGALPPDNNRLARIVEAAPTDNNPARQIVAGRTASVTAASPAEVPRAAPGPSAAEEEAAAATRAQIVPGEPPACGLAEEEAAGIVGAAAGGEGKQVMIEDKNMRLNTACRFTLAVRFTIQVTAASCALAALVYAAPQSKTAPAAQAPMSFATPQLAADALLKAAGEYDVPALMSILGPDAQDLVASGDPVRDKNSAVAVAAKSREKQQVVIDPKNSKRAILSLGNDDWPLPIPIVEKQGKWHFDTKAGREEILFRRIGENELDAIDICRGFVEAQKDYAREIHDNSGVNQYAQKIISTPGKQDGLAWKNADGTWGGPVGDAVANALQEGYVDKKQPFHGYYFKVLKGQGPDAFLGKLDYVIDGAMVGGFALVAVPADYRVTGVKTFMVSYDGVVYEKDLGPDSVAIVKSMELYNPDKTWHRTNDEE